jgi:VWFA-related protein
MSAWTHRITALPVIAFCLFAAPPPALKSALQDPVRFQNPIEHNVAVTLKLLQVYVTDRQGKPVTDLRKTDFRVFDKGVPMTITEFERHALEPSATSATTGLTGSPAANSAIKDGLVVADGAPPTEQEKLLSSLTPPIQAMSRKFFIFFDFAFNNQRGVAKSKEAALHFIDRELKPGDEVGLVSYGLLGGLSIHEYLTTDHKKVREAVEKLSAQRLVGRVGDIEEQYWRQGAEGTLSKPSYEDEALGSVKPKVPNIYNWQRQESKSQAENFLLKLTSFAAALRYVPGQKHIVLFTTGVATSMIYGSQSGDPIESVLIGTNSRSRFETGDHVLRSTNEELLKQLSAANCTVFTFDTRESAIVPSLFTYDEQTFEESYRDLFYDEGVRQDVTNPLKDQRVTGQYSLRRMATVTGGKYFSNILDYKNTLSQVQDLTGMYYVLGYSLGERPDGEYHELRVEVDRKGCVVRTQAGYYDPKPYAEYSDLEKQLQLYDLALSERSFLRTPLPFAMSALSFTIGGESRIQVLSKIPNAVMEKFSGKTSELVALIFDDQDNLLGLQRYETDLSKFKGMDVFYTSGAWVPTGRFKARLVIRDMENGSAAVASTRVSVVAKPLTGLGLHSPLLLTAESNFAYLESVAAKKTGRPDWKDAYPYERARYSPLLGGLPRNTRRIYALLPCSTAGLVQPEITVAAWLIDAGTGEKVPVRAIVMNKTESGSLDVLSLEVDLTGAPAGRYRIYFQASDAASNSLATTQTALVINP